MVSQFVQDIEPWISHARLEAYRPRHGDDLAMVTTYLHNVAMSEALHTPLGFLEVALRNSLHTSLSTLYGSTTWFKLPGILEPQDANAVAKITKRIQGEGNQRPPTGSCPSSTLASGSRFSHHPMTRNYGVPATHER